MQALFGVRTINVDRVYMPPFWMLNARGLGRVEERRGGEQRGLLSDWLIDCLAPRFLLRSRDRNIINKNGGRREGEFSGFV